MKVGLTFDDVALVPQYNNVPSRLEPFTDTWVTDLTQINVPIINSPMDTVIGYEMAFELACMGSLPLLHRYHINEKQFKKSLQGVRDGQGKCFMSIGVNENLRTIVPLAEKNNDVIIGINIDVAHGHSKVVMDLISRLKNMMPHMQVMAGAVCTPIAYQDLVNAGANAVRVGVGPGSACTTRLVTGYGVPQFTALYECGKLSKKLRIPIVCDGGIRDSRDLVIALAAGANSVLLGKLLCATNESAAEKRHDPGTYWVNPATHEAVGHLQAKYRGQSSASFQEDVFGSVKEGTVPEGEDFWVPIQGSVKDVIGRLLAGLRSGLTYGGARNIKELQRKAEFIRVTSTYFNESGIRI